MCSKTWFDKERKWVYKQQPKTLCDNEIYCLHKMSKHNYAPIVERVETEILRIKYIEAQVVTDRKAFMWHLPMILHILSDEGIRHGDLSIYSVIPHDNRPYLIDFAESRVTCDPRPDKRPEGDEYWLTQTMEFFASGNLV